MKLVGGSDVHMGVVLHAGHTGLDDECDFRLDAMILPPSIISHFLQVFRSVIGLSEPLFQRLGISNFDPNLKRFRIHRQSIRKLIAAHAIQNWRIAFLRRWENLKCSNHS